jgi:hypothetical protein
MRRRIREELEAARVANDRLIARLRQAEHNETLATERMTQAIAEHIIDYDSSVWTTETFHTLQMHIQAALEAIRILVQPLESMLRMLEENS